MKQLKTGKKVSLAEAFKWHSAYDGVKKIFFTSKYISFILRKG